MRRYHLLRALRAADPSPLEERSFLTGILSVAAAVALAVVNQTAAGPARFMGSVGLAAVMLCATSRGFRLYRAGTTASLPKSVAGVRVRTRPARTLNVITVAVALVLPSAVGIAVLVAVEWAWLVVSVVLLIGCAAGLVPWLRRLQDEVHDYDVPPAASALLHRLCMRAGMQQVELVVDWSSLATAWTARGQIHVTTALIDLLDEVELEAVLAHEVAHLAHRDAALIEICSAPSRVLLRFGRSVDARVRRWSDVLADGSLSAVAAFWIVWLLSVPPSFALGWISRLSVLGMSRSRELSADAAAATLTGRPSALMSALMKLDGQRDWTPRADLREVYADAVLCIMGTYRRGLRRVLSTHPPTEARVKRLEAMEARMQAGPRR